MRTIASLLFAALWLNASPAIAAGHVSGKAHRMQSVERSMQPATRAIRRGRAEHHKPIRVDQLIPDICKGCS